MDASRAWDNQGMSLEKLRVVARDWITKPTANEAEESAERLQQLLNRLIQSE
jgi:hypothetical protein